MPQGRRRHRRDASRLQIHRGRHGRAERSRGNCPHFAPSRLRERVIRKTNEKGGGPGRPASFYPLSGNPASLTEGDQPVVCWPAYIIPNARKKFLRISEILTRIAVQIGALCLARMPN